MRRRCIAATVMLAAAAIGCSGETASRTPYRVQVGDAAHGHQVILERGCGSCHTIPGVRGANGMVGPPLIGWSRRTYIAGQLPNTPENLVRWIQNPPAVERGTAMPVLGLDAAQARDVAAFLYSIR
jgi:cytochrome c2